MPELPEVETVRQTLRHLVLNRTIENVTVLYPAIVEGDVASFIQAVQGQTIREIDRKGKYLIFILDQIAFLSHLRMEGKYLFEPSSTPIEKHTHLIFQLDQGMDLRYHDVRKFGRLMLVDHDQYLSMEPLAKLAKEPFYLTAAELYAQLKDCHQPIKTALLDQTKIAGLGNIYANEVLFRAAIHPLTKASELSLQKVQLLLDCACAVLSEAITQGGTTIRSFSSNGIHGLFTQQLDVHGRDGEICHRCGYHIIKKKINTRTAYYCPKCQKIVRRRRKNS